jgi:hypothetical protein
MAVAVEVDATRGSVSAARPVARFGGCRRIPTAFFKSIRSISGEGMANRSSSRSRARDALGSRHKLK